MILEPFPSSSPLKDSALAVHCPGHPLQPTGLTAGSPPIGSAGLHQLHLALCHPDIISVRPYQGTVSTSNTTLPATTLPDARTEAGRRDGVVMRSGSFSFSSQQTEQPNPARLNDTELPGPADRELLSHTDGETLQLVGVSIQGNKLLHLENV